MKDKEIDCIEQYNKPSKGNGFSIWPTGDYSEHMPKGSFKSRLDGYFKNTSAYLDKAIIKAKKESE